MEELEFWLLDVSYDVVDGVPEIQLWGIDRSGRRVLVVDRSFRPYFYVLPSEDPEGVMRTLSTVLAAHGLLNLESVQKKYYGRPVKAIKVTLRNPRSVPEAREAAAKVKGVIDVLEADIRFYMRYMVDSDVRPSAWHYVRVKELPKPANLHVDAAYMAVERPVYIGGHPPSLEALCFRHRVL
jgi:DNA polymerase elongation subunit (family B)